MCIYISEMDENEHGILGLGNIIIKCDSKKKTAVLTGELIGEIKHNGDMAVKIIKGIVYNEEIRIVSKAKKLAAESCSTPYFRLHQNTSSMEVVFSQYLVYWFVFKYLHFTPTNAGLLFGKSCSTALRGIGVINTKDKYLIDIQRAWRKRFIQKINESGILKQLP
jgi:hypothetical protein